MNKILFALTCAALASLATPTFAIDSLGIAITPVECWNEATDVKIIVAPEGGRDIMLLEITGAEGTSRYYESDSFYLQGESLAVTAVDPDQLVGSFGVVGEGIMLQISRDSGSLAEGGFIKTLTCTWSQP